jgi:hypothetical protein
MAENVNPSGEGNAPLYPIEQSSGRGNSNTDYIHPGGPGMEHLAGLILPRDQGADEWKGLAGYTPKAQETTEQKTSRYKNEAARNVRANASAWRKIKPESLLPDDRPSLPHAGSKLNDNQKAHNQIAAKEQQDFDAVYNHPQTVKDRKALQKTQKSVNSKGGQSITSRYKKEADPANIGVTSGLKPILNEYGTYLHPTTGKEMSPDKRAPEWDEFRDTPGSSKKTTKIDQDEYDTLRGAGVKPTQSELHQVISAHVAKLTQFVQLYSGVQRLSHAHNMAFQQAKRHLKDASDSLTLATAHKNAQETSVANNHLANAAASAHKAQGLVDQPLITQAIGDRPGFTTTGVVKKSPVQFRTEDMLGFARAESTAQPGKVGKSGKTPFVVKLGRRTFDVRKPSHRETLSAYMDLTSTPQQHKDMINAAFQAHPAIDETKYVDASGPGKTQGPNGGRYEKPSMVKPADSNKSSAAEETRRLREQAQTTTPRGLESERTALKFSDLKDEIQDPGVQSDQAAQPGAKPMGTTMPAPGVGTVGAIKRENRAASKSKAVAPTAATRSNVLKTVEDANARRGNAGVAPIQVEVSDEQRKNQQDEGSRIKAAATTAALKESVRQDNYAQQRRDARKAAKAREETPPRTSKKGHFNAAAEAAKGRS